ncbi:MAG: tRNA pseudouridine(38-40) synthase TruA [Actinomycetota bacterium]|jgi:tRNA pseudouridine38-40 synthase|nr:tRNA pseudouridine(38-40) synthase TruA [Actinomycetota bacterium]
MSGSTRVRIDLAYRGSSFHGFAANPDVPSVETELVSGIEKVLRHPVSLIVAGRTDRGVHATGQVVSFSTTAAHFDPLKLKSALNKLCAPDIAIQAVNVVDENFHARFSATGRRYRYRLLVSDVPDPLRSDIVWCVPPPVSIDLLNEAASKFVGSHDFSGYCRRPKGQPEADLTRVVSEATWTECGDELHFVVSANAFCQQMVRSIVGTTVEIARGRMSPDVVDRLLETGDRSLAPEVCPPQGLALEAVLY